MKEADTFDGGWGCVVVVFVVAICLTAFEIAKLYKGG